MNEISKILVTGGCGAIGSEVINRLKQKHPHIYFVNLDALTYAGKQEHIEDQSVNYKFINGNICDVDLVYRIFMEEKPQVVLHFAAETHVDNSFGNSFRFTQSNVFGTHCMLECVHKFMTQFPGHFKLFVHMSTDEVYGSVPDDEEARSETALFAPSNPYSATKAGAEMLCHAYMKSFKIPIIITRCNNAISKYQHEEKLIPRTISRLLNNEKMTVQGDGTSKRTFIHAYDIADAFDVILEKGDIGQVYNIGTDIERNILEVVADILCHLKPGENLEDWIEYVEDRAFQDYRYYIDTTALRNLGWENRITFEMAIQDVVLHWLKVKVCS
jgi:UDP-glucose 4,6-dehydratase